MCHRVNPSCLKLGCVSRLWYQQWITQQAPLDNDQCVPWLKLLKRSNFYLFVWKVWVWLTGLELCHTERGAAACLLSHTLGSPIMIVCMHSTLSWDFAWGKKFKQTKRNSLWTVTVATEMSLVFTRSRREHAGQGPPLLLVVTAIHHQVFAVSSSVYIQCPVLERK